MDGYVTGRRPMVRRWAWAAGALSIALVVNAAPTRAVPAKAAASTLTLTGAGSTFVAPFFTAAFAAYSATHPVHVTYQAIGSYDGVSQFIQGNVAFADSDVPLSAAQRAQAGGNLTVGGAPVQVPVALGAEAIVYDLPSLGSKAVRLDGPTVGRIYQGAVTQWDDPTIRALNPGLALPHLTIVPVHRLDGSGTTYIFTDYLSAVSRSWATEVGKGLLVSWPVGLGGSGNGGVAAAVVQQPGSIGYVELAYALSTHLAYAQLKNSAGGTSRRIQPHWRRRRRASRV